MININYKYLFLFLGVIYQSSFATVTAQDCQIKFPSNILIITKSLTSLSHLNSYYHSSCNDQSKKLITQYLIEHQDIIKSNKMLNELKNQLNQKVIMTPSTIQITSLIDTINKLFPPPKNFQYTLPVSSNMQNLFLSLQENYEIECTNCYSQELRNFQVKLYENNQLLKIYNVSFPLIQVDNLNFNMKLNLNNSALTQVFLIKPGQIVNIEIIKNGLIIQAKGLAQTGGKLGDIIQINNIKNNHRFSGKIVSEQLVTVTL